MKRCLALILVFGQVFLGQTFSFTAYAAPAVPITAASALLLNGQGNTAYFSKTPHIKRAPASTTKILTAIVAVNHLDLDRVITIPAFVTSIEPSKIHLRPGERYYVRDLIKATLINSANDAAETLAYVAGGGSRARFANMMNAKVRAIGGKHSKFVRASGLPAANQYSTAYDMALVMREAQRYPFIVNALATRTTVIKSLSGRRIGLRNHNKMLWKNSRVVGKTGWTRSARHCFVGVIRTSSGSAFVSMLGSRALWKDLARLVDYQFGLSYKSAKTTQKVWSNRDKNKKIQVALKKAGYYRGIVDGQIGPQTRRAVKKFQKAHKLPQTGNVGPLTTAKLQPYL